ncbi:MAG: 5-(carboxyamino)imidazole ribonucleotide synthase [Alistipes sp.]|nr:5-(carboxyamino)imidazole ribonucleotide synthase [Alistipes sp.]MDE7129043.1 5-(carboxyamino)imidazole ribonucleotide synthase [Alistipes sp.]
MTRTIGIIGAGQLGLMIAQAAAELGARTICLDPSADAPAFKVCDEHIVAPFDDIAALEELCGRSDVVTYEFENVPGDILRSLTERYNIKQGIGSLIDSQDRLREKSRAVESGLRCARFADIADRETLKTKAAEFGYSCILKSRRLGYDGHGQAVIRSIDDLADAERLLSVPCILEEFVRFDYEASVICVGDEKNGYIHFPVGRNVHSGGILDLCIVPAPEMSDDLRRRMVEKSEEFMRRNRYRGILAIEYFVAGDDFFFNEMAPRPHNSGHYTIEGCTTDQYRELCRYLLDMPLEEPQLKATTVMKNILGQDLAAAETIAAESRDDVYVHLYGKSESLPKRKMGHITFVGLDGRGYDEVWRDKFVKQN